VKEKKSDREQKVKQNFGLNGEGKKKNESGRKNDNFFLFFLA
jgi:hypothetical protein